ncbi:MAG: hypothetical protein LBE12_20110 [Planctomycetaceae bacterium]|nr:hypothetical protein [Planctomycetaceae bacterium]
MDSVASGIIAVWVIIRLRHYPLSTLNYQLSTIQLSNYSFVYHSDFVNNC